MLHRNTAANVLRRGRKVGSVEAERLLVHLKTKTKTWGWYMDMEGLAGH